jgi:hypothetical protein
MDVTARPAAIRHKRGSTARRNAAATQEPNMTASFTRTIRQAGLVLGLAASLAALTSTSSFAFSSEAQQMCTSDAFRLCSSEIPNIPKITACMFKNKAQLSAGCRSVMDREAAAQKSSKVAAQ